jgi:hypothetical protein
MNRRPARRRKYVEELYDGRLQIGKQQHHRHDFRHQNKRHTGPERFTAHAPPLANPIDTSPGTTYLTNLRVAGRQRRTAISAQMHHVARGHRDRSCVGIDVQPALLVD